jgi:hypothetical protein
MARETVAQRKEREAKELAEMIALKEQAYPKQFLETLELAVREGFELIEVDAASGAFTFRYEQDTYVVYNTLKDAGYSQWPLDDLQAAVQDVRSEREASQRRYELKTAALAKLSAEEREALGV